MSDVHSGDEDEGSSQKGIKECLDKCRCLEQLHRDEIEVKVSQRGRFSSRPWLD